MKKVSWLIGLMFVLGGCSWVQVTPEGKIVRLVESLDQVEQCEKLGTTTSSVLPKFVFERGKEKVAAELADLARNSAADMGGDTIVPISAVEEGKRTFGVYQCGQP